MHPNQVVNTRRLRERKAKDGQKQVTVWVPLDRVDELKEIARKMRDSDTPQETPE